MKYWKELRETYTEGLPVGQAINYVKESDDGSGTLTRLLDTRESLSATEC